ncbi:hypothetical protein ACPUYX_04305 [Desulfosporosinus sp. SYSU MS00001]|uniref:hypothetical protein n=1 Tax=Desulfosporosinus sp. SYSU MS00001 TaxID=3416284 RepID=UPI003CF1AD7F
MRVIWETRDLAEIILSLKPALCDLVSKTGEHLVLPILSLDTVSQEVISCQITNFFLRNSLSSVLAVTFEESNSSRMINMYKGFWVFSSKLFDTINLRYTIIPNELIKREIANIVNHTQHNS